MENNDMIHISDGTLELLNYLENIAKNKKYNPSLRDFLLLKIKSSGVSELKMTIHNMQYSITEGNLFFHYFSNQMK